MTAEAQRANLRAFLDSVQYSRTGILRYERIFGPGFVSTGGLETTKVRATGRPASPAPSRAMRQTLQRTQSGARCSRRCASDKGPDHQQTEQCVCCSWLLALPVLDTCVRDLPDRMLVLSCGSLLAGVCGDAELEARGASP